MSTDGMSPAGPEGQPLGMVVDGSISRGVEVRLHSSVSVEEIKNGIHVTIQGQRERFIGIVTDVALGSADQSLKLTPPDVDNPYIAQVISGALTYGSLSVLPMLILPQVLGDDQGPSPAKTVPAHFSQVFRASQRDEEMVFGQEDRNHFWIGSPLDMETKVCLNLEEFVRRSSGIFGKSGTGKTFLTRLLLVGILQKDVASSLIFDMHSEYGWMGQDTDRGTVVKGLKQLFPTKVAVFSLDEESSLRRGVSPDFVVQIGYDEIEPEDVELLRQTLNLSDVAASSAYNLDRKFGRGWLKAFMETEDLQGLADELNINYQALRALHNRLSRLHRLGFIVPKALDDSVTRIIESLEQGKHIVLEFGRWGNDLTAYVLVANLLTRRIHQRYVSHKERSDADGSPGPRPLVIVIEEAHRFLDPGTASQTTFGTIAREDRKFNITLMVIDQRPSSIDAEVLSQVGTKVACLLDNERDIDATLSGVAGSRELRAVLARLDPKQQALIFGQGVPMPVVVKIRPYGAGGSYTDLTQPSWMKRDFSSGAAATEEEVEARLKELF